VLLGFAAGTRAACPALDPRGRCSLHDAGKPRACRAVPLDPWRADEEQPNVLQIRAKEARSWGIDCIDVEPTSLSRPLTRGLRVVDPEGSAALAERRQDLEHEKQIWGTEVFRALDAELCAKPESLASLPRAGFFVLSIVPVLLIAARSSAARVRAYLAAQARVAQGMLEHPAGSSAHLQQLMVFAETNARLQRALGAEG